ncbi:hypothetical protein SAMN05216554_3465 [Herbiconiux ginsengi]|uniref:Uncharacterized protein n=2 Tax=Herbiconiux ginsengi TaxID=381665 RepID=A0A1H3SDS9_9MICO|nr:hypothetical protein SAMN05216554_3465 [Herbiconiux ginsengi]
MFGSFRPEGWNPRLRVHLRGPAPAGGELVWSVARPDGSPWFEHRVAVPELDAQQTTVLDLQRWVDGGDLGEPGTVAFALRIVSALDGVDLPLHTGSLTAVALDGEQRYAIDNDWMLGLGLLCLNAVDEYDAPRLTATIFLKGQVDTSRLEAHCFHEGRRIARATFVDNRHAFTANDGTVVGQEITVSFDDVRGWNNLRDSGWGSDWHLLDQHDGAYQVTLSRDSTVARVIRFEVSDGRITTEGAVEDDPGSGAVILVDAAVEGSLDGAWRTDGAPAFYGDAVTAASWVGVDAVYARRIDRPVAPDPVFDDQTTAALQAFVDRAERLLTTWEAGLLDSTPPFDTGQMLAADAVLREQAEYSEMRDKVVSVPGEHPVTIASGPASVGDLRERMEAVFAAARSRLSGAAQAEEDELAPYRALLAGDKLAVFEEHPANAFVYTTTDRRVIETPEELAAAEYWYFEGPLDVPSTASVDGVTVKVSVQGWRVLGWQFDETGAIVDEFETQGPGSSAPKSAFQRDR